MDLGAHEIISAFTSPPSTATAALSSPLALTNGLQPLHFQPIFIGSANIGHLRQGGSDGEGRWHPETSMEQFGKEVMRAREAARLGAAGVASRQELQRIFGA